MPDQWEGFLDELTPARYRQWVADMERREIHLYLPKVKLEGVV